MRHFGVTVSWQVDQGQPFAHCEKVQAARASWRLTGSSKISPSSQSVQKGAFAYIRTSRKRNFDPFPAWAFGDCQSRAQELRIKPHLFPVRYSNRSTRKNS